MVTRSTQGTASFSNESYAKYDLKHDYGDTGSDTYDFDEEPDNELYPDDDCFQSGSFASDNTLSESHGALAFAPPNYGSTVRSSDSVPKVDEVRAAHVTEPTIDTQFIDAGLGQQTNDAGSMHLAFHDGGNENKTKPLVAFSDIPSPSVIVGEAVEALKAADVLRQGGKTDEAQVKYEEALKKIKEVDMATITSQWQSQVMEYNLTAEKLNALGNPPSDPREAEKLTTELQKGQNNGLQLEKMLQAGKDVKVQYANFLNEQGKRNEALILLTDAGAQTPSELLARDKTFEEQLEKAQSIGSITSGDAEKHRVLLEQAMIADDFPTAKRELASLKEAVDKTTEATIDDMKDRYIAISMRQSAIDTEVTDLQKNSKMSEDAKALRQKQLANVHIRIVFGRLGASIWPANRIVFGHPAAFNFGRPGALIWPANRTFLAA